MPLTQEQGAAQAYQRTFTLLDGDQVLNDLIERFAKPPFAPGQPDVTAFNCGTKAVVEHILAQISKADPAGK